MTSPDRLLSAIRAALDDTERLVGEYETWIGQRVAGHSYVLVTPPGWGPGEPFDRDTVLRLVAAMREIVALYEFVTGHGPAVDHVRAMDMTTGAESALRDVVRALAHGLGIDPEDTR
ncbi:MAG TPA: hypothetical protein VFY84_12625 [Jiangellales bacterium]|nr:hypothetical protein [Jiangellales bacterium]